MCSPDVWTLWQLNVDVIECVEECVRLKYFCFAVVVIVVCSGERQRGKEMETCLKVDLFLDVACGQ